MVEAAGVEPGPAKDLAEDFYADSPIRPIDGSGACRIHRLLPEVDPAFIDSFSEGMYSPLKGKPMAC